MKKLLLATAAASLLFFGGQADVSAAPVDDLNITATETQELGKWSHFRDKYILDRDDRDRRYRARDRYYRDHRYDPPPPPPRHRYDHRYDPPPPPPRHHRDHRYDPPPPPPPRW